MLDLTPIEKRLTGISKWPWQGANWKIDDANANPIGHAAAYPYSRCSGLRNAAFFREAPQTISDLIEEVKRLREEMVGMEEAWNEAEYRCMEKDPYG